MFIVPEKYRVERIQNPFTGEVITNSTADGNNGVFKIPLSKYTTAFCIASDGMGWEHVSVHIEDKTRKKYQQQRVPSWEEMCWIKDLFWSKEDTVIQYHPAKKDYVNNHPYTLHLWRPIENDFPKPPKVMV